MERRYGEVEKGGEIGGRVGRERKKKGCWWKEKEKEEGKEEETRMRGGGDGGVQGMVMEDERGKGEKRRGRRERNIMSY